MARSGSGSPRRAARCRCRSASNDRTSVSSLGSASFDESSEEPRAFDLSIVTHATAPWPLCQNSNRNSKVDQASQVLKRHTKWITALAWSRQPASSAVRERGGVRSFARAPFLKNTKKTGSSFWSSLERAMRIFCRGCLFFST